MKSILVICEGNICRSPMAQGLLAAGLPGVQVRSAGLSALIGSPADDIAIRLMDELKIDIRPHRATQVTRLVCTEADLILAMDADQRNRASDLLPLGRGRIFRLGEHIKTDIPDPYRQGEAQFRLVLSLIQQATANWLELIQKL